MEGSYLLEMVPPPLKQAIQREGLTETLMQLVKHAADPDEDVEPNGISEVVLQ